MEPLVGEQRASHEKPLKLWPLVAFLVAALAWTLGRFKSTAVEVAPLSLPDNAPEVFGIITGHCAFVVLIVGIATFIVFPRHLTFMRVILYFLIVLAAVTAINIGLILALRSDYGGSLLSFVQLLTR